jgi:flavodoxin
VLVALFSHSGNTRAIARQIQEAVGGDLFEITPVTPYPADYNACVEQAKREQAAGVLPPLAANGSDLEDYRLIFIGSPNWWNTIAPPVKTFLGAHDFAGKTIVPFITHEGSRAGRSGPDVKRLCLSATVLDARAFWGSEVQQADEEVHQWLRGLKLLKG